MLNSKLFAFFAIVVGAVFIGFSGITFRYSGMQPASGIFWRMFFALPFFYIWMRLEKSAPMRVKAHWPMLVAGLFFALDMTTFHAALNFTGVGKATLIGSMATLIVVVISLFLGEKLTKTISFALLMAICGTALIVATKSNFIPHAGELKGDLIAMMAAFFFAAYILYVRHARATIAAGRFNFYMSLFCAGFSLIFALILGENIWPQTPAAWGYLLILGVFIQAIGQGLTTFALGKIPAGVGSIAMTFNAPISAIGSAFLLSEYLAPLQILGGFMVIIALVLVRPK